jgi:AcrR family transcriptional regulator
MPENNTRTNILLAAVELFSKRGYEGVSMKAIAQAVDISAPALYNHFKDKRALYNATVASAFENKAQQLQLALLGDDEPMLRLQTFVTRSCFIMKEDAEFRRLVQREVLDEDKDRLQYLSEELFAPLFSSMMGLLEELKPDSDTHLLAVIIIGMVQKPFELNPLDRFFSGSRSEHIAPAYISQQVIETLTPFLTKRPD